MVMDHYKVLGLNRSASKAEIKEAFRKLALEFHPDKHSESSKTVRDGAILKFKRISESYGVLIDDQKRNDYNIRSSSSGSGSGGGGVYGYYSGKNSYYSPSNYRTTGSSQSSAVKGRNFNIALHYLTSRGFLLNLVFASMFLSGAVIIGGSGQTLWKVQNSGKSFEEAVESIEKIKTEKEEKS